MNIAQNIKEIRRRAEQAGGGGNVTLVAACKAQTAEAVRQAVAAGVDAAGENRVQELVEKDALGAYGGVPLHFIGRLQKNKAAKVVGRVSLIHSVDSMALAETIDNCAGKLRVVQPVLAQVNIALEETKGGFAPDSLPSALNTMSALKNLRVRGLMCIPPPGETRYFEQMRRLFDLYRAYGLEILSMGMSDDYEAAIRAGANMIRVGSALFGARA
ncbi:MAG: YggS family pyridoxal phosphate-dependent enzyme [Oscillospiraceae bacterium]|nr:YggS family pyridoxal phosphate-dependent enzyme [Oscillospiraceae bacterium]